MHYSRNIRSPPIVTNCQKNEKAIVGTMRIDEPGVSFHQVLSHPIESIHQRDKRIQPTPPINITVIIHEHLVPVTPIPAKRFRS